MIYNKKESIIFLSNAYLNNVDREESILLYYAAKQKRINSPLLLYCKIGYN